MEQENENIKKEFDNKIKNIEELDKSKSDTIFTLCVTASIILFIAILVGTIVSINNYLSAKKVQESNVPVVTFKKYN